MATIYCPIRWSMMLQIALPMRGVATSTPMMCAKRIESFGLKSCCETIGSMPTWILLLMAELSLVSAIYAKVIECVTLPFVMRKTRLSVTTTAHSANTAPVGVP
jgi:hypothetical protein